jgi:predicted DNA-binding transcriptional regulator AlpA
MAGRSLKSTRAAGWAEPGGMGPDSTTARDGFLLAGMSNPSTTAASVAPQASHDSTNLETAIDSRETARILGLSPVTLQQIRARGEGPPFFRIGRTVRYRLGDVIAWRNERTVGRKTP